MDLEGSPNIKAICISNPKQRDQRETHINTCIVLVNPKTPNTHQYIESFTYFIVHMIHRIVYIISHRMYVCMYVLFMYCTRVYVYVLCLLREIQSNRSINKEKAFQTSYAFSYHHIRSSPYIRSRTYAFSLAARFDCLLLHPPPLR